MRRGRPPAGAEAVTLKATSQGCADLGVCYPPNTQSLQVALAAMSTAPAAPIEAAGGAPEDESSKLAGLLKHAKLTCDGDTLELRVVGPHRALISESVERRLQQAADELGMDYALTTER